MINRIWTILNRGVVPASAFSRKLSPYLFSDRWPNQQALDILVPFRGPVLERHFRIEQLVQGLLRSSVADAARQLDPLNTYEKATISYPVPGFQCDSIYTAYFSDPRNLEESFSADCALDPVNNLFYVNDEVQAYTVASGLTSLLQLPNETLVRFRGPFYGVDSFLVSGTPYLTVPWPELLQRLELVEIAWSDNDLRSIWQNDYFWLNRISAVVLEIARGA